MEHTTEHGDGETPGARPRHSHGLALDVFHEGRVRPSVLLQKGTHFAWLRTRMSAERTLMAHVRTAIALIGFGFTLFQFFERFGKALGLQHDRAPFAVWSMSVALIAIGTLSTVLALYQYYRLIQYLRSPGFADVAGTRRRLVFTSVPVIAVLISIVGVGALLELLVGR